MEKSLRAGGKTLTLLGSPRIFLILRSLSEGTKGSLELRRDAGAPAQSTMRGHLRALEEIGAMVKQRRDAFPGALQYDLTEVGRELLVVAGSLERWLARAPNGPLELGSDPAKAAVKGLVEGWSAAVLTTLASGPLSLTELDKRIAAISYPSIERCLETMRLAEQLEVGSRGPKGTPYTLTDWLRRGLTPLSLAARWEHRHRPDGAESICQDDIEGAILVGGPLFELSGEVSGVCQLAVRVPDSKREDRTLAYLDLKDGQIAFGAVYSEVKPDAWASGTLDSWFATVIDADTSGLRMSGDRQLTQAILDGVRVALFGGEDALELGVSPDSSAGIQGGG